MTRFHRIRRTACGLLGVSAALAVVIAGPGASAALAVAEPAAVTTVSEPAPPSAPTSAAKAAAAGHVVIAIDTAPRFSNQRFESSKTAARSIINALPDAQFSIISFGGQATMVYPPGPGKGSIAALDSLSQNSGELDATTAQSQMTQGLALGVDTMQGATGQRAIVLITDGTNNGSAVSLESSRQSALKSGIRISVVDTREEGDTEPTKQALLSELQGVKGIVVPLDKPERLSELTTTLLASDAPSELALRSDGPGLSTGLLSSNLTLLLGALLMGGAIFFGAMQLLGPREMKVNLTGIPEIKVAAKDVKTPMAGLATKLTELADKKLEDSGRNRGMQSWLERASINLRSGEFVIVVIVSTLALTVFMWQWKSLTWGLLMLVVGPFGARFYVNRKAKKRSKRFADQLSDTLQLISSSMRAGQGFMQALDAVARESEAPTAEEFQRVVVEARLGRDLVDSMKALAERIRCEDLEWVIPAVEINREVGGDLAEVLEQVGSTIRDRADLRRQVKTLSAEGRLSAVVLIGLPLCIGGFIKMSNPTYMQPLFEGTGLFLLGGAALMMLVGSIWLFNICKIEF